MNAITNLAPGPGTATSEPPAPAPSDAEAAPSSAGEPALEPPRWNGRSGTLGYVAKMFPRISETFILDEILALRRSGVPVKIYSLLPPVRDACVHPEAEELIPEVQVLARQGMRRALGMLADASACVQLRPIHTLRLVLRVMLSAHPRRSLRRLERGLYLARCLRRDHVAHVHAAWAHTPEGVVRIAGRLTGIPWSMGAHAKDIHLADRASLAKKVGAARFTLTCTEANRELLASLAPLDEAGEQNAEILLVHHGVDSRAFAPRVRPSHGANGATPVILSVGRLVPKKGFSTLLEAAALLARRGTPFELEILGGGPERDRLERLAGSLGLDGRVAFRGMAVREDVRAAYARASCFALACRIGADGDRDGIPNTLAEAMACGLPVVGTRLPGIEEVVRDHETGRLVPPDDPAALADALAEVLEQPDRTTHLGARARAWVVEHFDAGANGLRRARRLARALGIERVLYVSADRGIPVRGHKGASVHVRSVVAALAEVGIETRILTAREGPLDGPSPVGRLVETRSDRVCGGAVRWLARAFGGGEPLERALLRLLDNIWLHMAARRITTRWKPDLVYERYALTAFAGAWLARHLRVPFMLEVNAPLANEERTFRGLRLGALARWTEGLLLRRADRVVVVSPALHEWARRRGVPPERLLLLPNAVAAGWAATEPAARAIRAREGLDGAFVVGFCGSLKPWHGVSHLLEAAARAAVVVHPLRVLVVGDGPERDALERRAAALGMADRTRFTGSVPHDQVPAHLAACDLLVAPYEHVDGFYFSPLKLAEYLRIGRPVLVSAVGDIPRMVEAAPQATLLPPADVEALATAIVRQARGEGPAPTRDGRPAWTWNDVVRRILEAGEEARRSLWRWTP